LFCFSSTLNAQSKDNDNTRFVFETADKEFKEFKKHSRDVIEKESVEFKKHERIVEEKDKAEFQKFVFEKPEPKTIKDYTKIRSEKVKKNLVSQPKDTASKDSIANSVFDNFRVPVRENINESYLLYAGWKTDPNTYTFRCKNKKRVRLTFWYTDLSAKEDMEGSEFINVTPTIDECNESDRMYEHEAPAAPQIIRTKVKIEKVEEPKEENVKKKKPKKKKYRAWEGLKK